MRSCSGPLSLATRDGHSGPHRLCGNGLGLVGSTNEGAVRLTHNSLGNLALAGAPNLGADDNLQLNHVPFGVVGESR